MRDLRTRRSASPRGWARGVVAIVSSTTSMATRKEKSQLNQKVAGFSALYEVAKILGKALELSQALSAILRILNSFMGMSKGIVYLYDRNRREFGIEAAFGLTDEERRRNHYRVGEGIAGKVVKLGIPMVVPDIRKRPQFLNKTRARKTHEPHAVTSMCLPMKIGGEVLGMLSVERPSQAARESVEEDLRVLTIVAFLIGHAVKLRQEQVRNLHSVVSGKGLRELERDLVMWALKETGGVQVKAAARLGITPRQFAYKMRKFRIIKEFRVKG